jgi:hypothetical protein
MSTWVSFRCSNAAVTDRFRSHAGGAAQQRNGCYTSSTEMRLPRCLART